MRTPLLLLIAIALALAGAPAAHAGTATFANGHFAFTAAPGEQNFLTLETTSDCGTLAAPCLEVSDRYDYALAAPAGCVAEPLGIRCPIPASVALDTGDRLDVVDDWDGPSTIDGGDDGDVIRGRGGDDVLRGEDGDDTLIGGLGNDTIEGGAGADWLESFNGGIGIGEHLGPDDSAGTDTLRGGRGHDTVSYAERHDPLTITLDGRANDGAPGEGDLVDSDIEGVVGGSADDDIAGSPGLDQLAGQDGDDRIDGKAGDDEVDAGDGEDVVSGGDGTDSVFGGGGADTVDAGPGMDYVYGEYSQGCGIALCIGGSDEIQARDGAHDWFECGPGTDHVTIDKIDETEPGTDCERIDSSGGKPGRPRSECDILSGRTRKVCLVVVAAIHRCDAAHGKRRRRCLERSAKRATKTCRTRFHGRTRKACVREVRRLL
jgi:hemolysin type calcium-binding protein